MPRQAAYLAAHRVPGRANAFAPRHVPRAPGRPNYQHRSEFRFFSPEDIQRPLKYPHVRPQMGNFATASRRESDPIPPPRSRGVQREPLGPLSQNRRRISGWELESQIWGPPPCVRRPVWQRLSGIRPRLRFRPTPRYPSAPGRPQWEIRDRVAPKKTSLH